MDALHSLLNPLLIIKTLGLLGIVFIIFAESGLFFGFFFPGDSLIFTAGYLASQGYLSIAMLMFLCPIAAIVGDNFGYAFGKKTGPLLFKREDSLFFKKQYVEKAQKFYEKYGKKTILFARFVPIVRTFAPIVAGVAGMEYKTFATFNVVGGMVWTWGMLGVGYFLGKTVPNASSYLTPIIIAIILLSFLPPIIEFLRRKKVN